MKTTLSTMNSRKVSLCKFGEYLRLRRQRVKSVECPFFRSFVRPVCFWSPHLRASGSIGAQAFEEDGRCGLPAAAPRRLAISRKTRKPRTNQLLDRRCWPVARLLRRRLCSRVERLKIARGRGGRRCRRLGAAGFL